METIQQTRTHIFGSKEAYLAFKAAWAKLAQEKKITSPMLLFYNFVRGKDPKRGFTPVTNQNKLVNGAQPEHAFKSSLGSLTSLATTYRYEFKGWPPVFDKKIWQGAYLTDFVEQFSPALTENVMTIVINKILSYGKP